MEMTQWETGCGARFRDEDYVKTKITGFCVSGVENLHPHKPEPVSYQNHIFRVVLL
jgi:hypothetical protein